MNIVTFRDALRIIGARFWPKRQVQRAPIIRHPFSDSITQEMAKAIAVSPSAIERILTAPYVRMGDLPLSMSMCAAAGCSLRLPFPETIFHIHVGPQHTNQSDAWSLVVDTGKDAYPDIVSLGLFWKHLAHIAVVLSSINSLRKDVTLWDTKKGKPLTSGTQFEEAMEILTDQLQANREAFPAELTQTFNDSALAMEMARLRPLLFRLYDPDLTLVGVMPKAGPDKTAEWLAARSHFEILDAEAIARMRAQGQRLAGDDWSSSTHTYLPLPETPTCKIARPSADVTPAAKTSFVLGKETADSPHWLLIAEEMPGCVSRLQKLLSGDWEVHTPLSTYEIILPLARAAVKNLMAMKVLPQEEAPIFRLRAGSPYVPRTMIGIETCEGCLKAGRGMHPTYFMVPLNEAVSDHEAGTVMSTFMARWTELHPELMGSHGK
jgi:hypothetical protein